MLSIILSLIILVLLLFLFFREQVINNYKPFQGQIFQDSKKVDPSYILFATYCAGENLLEKGRVYLLDLRGRIVHDWETQYQAFVPYLKKNGHLVVSQIAPYNLENSPGGRTGIIHELDWNGNILWEFEDGYIHHDFEILPGGNIAVVRYERVPKEISDKIGGGIPNSEFKGETYADSIIEIDHSTKETKWIWNAYEHLDPKKYSLGPLTPRSQWTYINSIRFVSSDPMTGEEAYLVSMRHLNKVMLISRKNGEIIWESSKRMLAYQHDATLLDNGNILVFDNGLFREHKRPSLWSRIVEIDPIKNEIVWQFDGGETGAEKCKFSSSIISGAQRLKNGNTFIVNGLQGYLFEVTPEKNVVWDFVSPFSARTTGPWPNNIIFKARRYRWEDIDWPVKIQKPI